MKTLVIQIGNSDNKLTQQEWHAFVLHVEKVVSDSLAQLHFFGCSDGAAPWQNACWVCVAEIPVTLILKDELKLAAKKYRQDSIAVTVGETVFVEAAK